MILAELVKDRVTVPMLLETYGVKVDRGGRCACPIHNGKDRNMSVKDKWFRCFRCNVSGTVIDLQMALSGSDFPTAVRELDELFGLGLEPKKPSEALRARLRMADRRVQKTEAQKQHEHNVYNYTLLCYLRRWLAEHGKDFTALDKVLDYYQPHDDRDKVPDAFKAARLLGLQQEMEVMMIAAIDGHTPADDDG